MSRYDTCKEQVLNTTLDLFHDKFLVATGGNVSMLVEGEELFAITPSRQDYRTLSRDDICVVDFNRNVVEGRLKPSVETPLHLAVYQNRPDTNAVIHTHQTFGSIYSLIDQPIPALFDEQAINLGNHVAVIPYARSGSPELIQNIIKSVNNHCNAYIMQNHGCLVLSREITQAARNVQILEKTASIYFYALSLNRKITYLPSNSEELLFGVLKKQQADEIQRKKIQTKSGER